MIRLCFYLTLLVASCAQVKPLTGGYEDTIPPSLIKSFPKNYSTNLSVSSFDFEFDEREWTGFYNLGNTNIVDGAVW